SASSPGISLSGLDVSSSGVMLDFTVMVGEDVVLPCFLKPPKDATKMTVEWGRPDLKPRFVFVNLDGEEYSADQNEAFRGRSSMIPENLKNGDVSLKLSDVRISDNGRYRSAAFIWKWRKTEICSASSPGASLSGLDVSSSGVMLDCSAAGWYPEPEMFWLDGDGNIMSAGAAEKSTDPDGVYTVSSRVTVEKRNNNNFTCSDRALHSFPGQSLQTERPRLVAAMLGDDVVLPCHLGGSVNPDELVLEWGRLDLNPRFVFMWFEGSENENEQNTAYKGRTSLFTDRLKDGDVSLRLTGVKHSDNGRFRCYNPKEMKADSVDLLVGRKTQSSIFYFILMLDCSAAGWYPEPEMFWLDGDGNIMSAGAAEKSTDPDGVYTVSSRVTVEKRNNNNFTCRVQQRDINQSRETHIHVPGGRIKHFKHFSYFTNGSVWSCFR
uniref:Ig-like domain-containing protein n=1 Tax=Poecilia mexicana TaxID=48701 RepID=A0A3B3XA49_9TELE